MSYFSYNNLFILPFSVKLKRSNGRTVLSTACLPVLGLLEAVDTEGGVNHSLASKRLLDKVTLPVMVLLEANNAKILSITPLACKSLLPNLPVKLPTLTLLGVKFIAISLI